MPLGAEVGQAEQGIRPKLALNGKAVVFRIGKPVVVEKSRRATDGNQERPVDVVVGAAGRDVQRRERGRKPLAFVLPRGAIDKRRREERWRADPKESVRGVTNLIEAGDVFKRGEEHPESSPNTGLTWPAQEPAPEPPRRIRCIGQADARSEIVVACGS